MTVKELIDKLQALPQDAEVYLDGPNAFESISLEHVGRVVTGYRDPHDYDGLLEKCPTDPRWESCQIVVL